jgi:alpha-beta hydrolase superfamily lysophospholipase
LILFGKHIDQTIDSIDGRHERETFVKEVVVTRGHVPLAMIRKRLARNGGGTKGVVLLVHGFGQNRYAWHLPSRSFANYLAKVGFDVFNLDLRGHGRSRHFGSRRSTSVSDYVEEDLPNAVEEIQAIAGTRPIFLVGHSLGGLVSYAAAPGLDGAIGGVASFGSPYHFGRGSTSLTAIATFVRLVNVLRLKPNPLVPLKPVGLTMMAFRQIAESPLYPVPWRGWHKGSMEPQVLQEHLRMAFDRAGLAELAELFDWAAQKRFGGRERDYGERFEKLDLPLLVVSGTHDDLAPPEGVQPAYAQSRSSDKTYRALPLGHIDLLVGREAPKTAWPMLGSWISARSGK